MSKLKKMEIPALEATGLADLTQQEENNTYGGFLGRFIHNADAKDFFITLASLYLFAGCINTIAPKFKGASFGTGLAAAFDNEKWATIGVPVAALSTGFFMYKVANTPNVVADKKDKVVVVPVTDSSIKTPTTTTKA